MSSFGKLWKLLEEDTPEDDKSLSLVKSGLSLRSGDCGNFWDDFLSLCGNADAMSELLDVPKEKITNWHSRITKLIDKAESQDSDKTNSKLIPAEPEEPTADFGKVDAVNPDARGYPS